MSDAVLFSRDVYFPVNNDIFIQFVSFENADFHSHDFYEFTVVISGSCVHYLNGCLSHISVGDAFLLIPGDVHKLDSPSVDFTHRNIMFSASYFEKKCEAYTTGLIEGIRDGKFARSFTLSPYQIQQIEELIPYVFPIKSSEKTELCTAALCGYVINAVIADSLRSGVNMPIWVISLMTELSMPRNMKDKLSSFTEKLSYNNEYMCRAFKRFTGMTMTDYFNRQKMLYAYSLFKTSSDSVTEIAHTVGIEDISYFYKIFRRAFGKTPGEVRK